MAATTTDPLVIEAAVLRALNTGDNRISNSGEFAAAHGFEHKDVANVLKSLVSLEFITTSTIENERWVLTDEGKQVLANGSPEAQAYNKVPAGGIVKEELMQMLGEVGNVAAGKAVAAKWLAVQKDGKIMRYTRVADKITDDFQEKARAASEGTADDKTWADLKGRKMAAKEKIKTFSVERGVNYAPERRSAATDLTAEMIANGKWKTEPFKPYKLEGVLGAPPDNGFLHPLMKVRTQFREVFLELGFEEMPTNNFVESSFWCFDSLFVPQQHPARDMQDTFFVADPAAATIPKEYSEVVAGIHTRGGFGSTGHKYEFSMEETKKNVLRTHTTAVSARMLHKLAQQKPFAPKKYFSIDRVFRNEACDATHLAEFHQVEGLIADKNVSLGDLMGILELFFHKQGITNLKFKPAYNPYTEPSMEIFSYHPVLKRWFEVGNSGVFRPEMLRPMGFPEDVSVIAWGLSLERPTMIKYGVKNIRDLFGHKVNFGMIRTNPICDITLEKNTQEDADS